MSTPTMKIPQLRSHLPKPRALAKGHYQSAPRGERRDDQRQSVVKCLSEIEAQDPARPDVSGGTSGGVSHPGQTENESATDIKHGKLVLPNSSNTTLPSRGQRGNRRSRAQWSRGRRGRGTLRKG